MDSNITLQSAKTLSLTLIVKVVAPALVSFLFYGAVPLYAVFLTYAAFYPAVSVAIDVFEAKTNKQASDEQAEGQDSTFDLDFEKITSLVIAVLVVVLFASVTLLPSLAFLTAYLPAVIAAFAGCEFVVAAFPFFKLLAKAKSLSVAATDAEKSDVKYDEKNGFYLISTVIAMTAVMFGAGLLVEANFVLAAATIAIVGLLSVFAFQVEREEATFSSFSSLVFLSTDLLGVIISSVGSLIVVAFSTDQENVKNLFVNLFNPIATIALASVFGLSGFGFLPALALTNPVFAAIWAIAIVAVSSGVFRSIYNADLKQLGWLLTAGLGYIAASLVVNPGVGFVAALGLGAASPVVWAAMIASPVVSVVTFKALSSAVATVKEFSFSELLASIKATFTVENVKKFARESLNALAFSSLVKEVQEVKEAQEVQEVQAAEAKEEAPLELTATSDVTSYDRTDQVKAIVNSLIWSVLVYGVASYIMAPAGTMFVAMLGANVAIALPLALAVYTIAAAVVKFDLFDAKATRRDTVKAFNLSDLNKKVGIVLLSLLTLSVGPVLAFSGIAMFEIFAATSVMQALTVATSVIVAATVWRTLDKALHNTAVEFVKAANADAKANKDSWGMIALKALGVILFAAVGYSLAAILPMFAGLVLPTWSALASGFAAVSVPGAFAATIAAAYATNIATYHAKDEKGGYAPLDSTAVERIDDDYAGPSIEEGAGDKKGTSLSLNGLTDEHVPVVDQGAGDKKGTSHSVVVRQKGGAESKTAPASPEAAGHDSSAGELVSRIASVELSEPVVESTQRQVTDSPLVEVRSRSSSVDLQQAEIALAAPGLQTPVSV